MKVSSIKAMILILATMMFLSACATTKLMVSVTKPAEVNLVKFKKIAVAEIDGRGGQDLAEEITQALFDSGRFEVLDRENLRRIMAEHNLNALGIVDEQSAVKLGKLLGAAAFIFGRVSDYDYDEKLTYSDFTDKKGVNIRDYTRKGTVTMKVNLSVTDLETGQIVATRKIEEQNTASESKNNDYPPDIDKKMLFDEVRKQVVSRFIKMIAPYEERVAVTLYSDSKMPELEQGISYAKTGQWDQSIKRFKKAIKKYGDDPNVKIHKAHFDLGIAYAYTNKFKEALASLNEAYQIYPDNRYVEEMENVKQMEKDYQKLQSQK